VTKPRRSIRRSVAGHPARWVLPLGLACLVLQLASSDVSAAAGEGRVAVLPFVGQAAEDVEDRLVAAIPREYDLIPLEQVDAAIEKAGDKLPTGPAEFVSLARRLGAAVIMEGRTSQDNGWRLRVTARRGNTGLAGAGV
jgi:hypothetical protein